MNPSSPQEAVLPRDVVLRLGDHKYEKRKSAALEIEHLVRELLKTNEDQVRGILHVLGSEFMNNSSPNYRKGGLIGLAACALGLMESAYKFMDLLIDPVLKCFEDPESRVRYYACESFYNIVKVLRGKVLDRFNFIFDGLCKLSVDVNIDVKNGAILLDGLMKDIVTETPSFQVETFIPLLKKYITKTNPHIRQLLVNWITALDAVPDIDMLVWLPTFLDGLFNMLSDVNRLIRNTADSALSDFLKELKRTTSVEFGPCQKSDVGMVATLVMHCKSKNILARITAILWIKEFVLLGKEQLVPHYGELLEAILAGTGHQEEEIRTTTAGANSVLMELVERTEQELDLSPLIERLTLHLVNENEDTRMTSHRWISMLLEKCPSQMSQCVDDFFFALLRTLEDESDAIVIMSLRNLALISREDQLFRRVLSKIVELFGSTRIVGKTSLLEHRGSLIVRHLCTLLSPEKVYRELSDIMSSHDDLEFVELMVQMLNLILLTADELEPMRTKLKGSLNGSEQDRRLFETVFNAWCHSPVSALSLCFLAQSYELASVMITNFGDAEITVGLLMQIDKLVQLLESPIFVHLRLQLLDRSNLQHEALMKSLYGLLMLLPQTTAYKTLYNRLTAVSSLHSALQSGGGSGGGGGGGSGSGKGQKGAQYEAFTAKFADIQIQHRDARWKRQREASLLKTDE